MNGGPSAKDLAAAAAFDLVILDLNLPQMDGLAVLSAMRVRANPAAVMILTAQSLSDRVLVQSALAIAERVTVDDIGELEVDIPYSSPKVFTSTAQDKVFCRVDGRVGSFLTGSEDLPVGPVGPGGVALTDGVCGTVGIPAG